VSRWAAVFGVDERTAARRLRQVLGGLLVILIPTDAGTGLVWLLSSPSRFTSPAYRVAQIAAPMPLWGALFLTGAAACTTALLLRGHRLVLGCLLAAVGGIWAFWIALFTLGVAGTQGATYLGAVFATSFTLLHALVGWAVSRPALAAVHEGR